MKVIFNNSQQISTFIHSRLIGCVICVLGYIDNIFLHNKYQILMLYGYLLVPIFQLMAGNYMLKPSNSGHAFNPPTKNCRQSIIILYMIYILYIYPLKNAVRALEVRISLRQTMLTLSNNDSKDNKISKNSGNDQFNTFQYP